MAISYDELRSARWFAPDTLKGFGHRSRLRQMGYDPEDWEGKPVIAILNTWSDINPCHAHFKDRVAWVKKGILQAGGFPIELPALSLSENFVKPSTMLYRNLLAMETEELLRSHPVDGAVLLGGCDKTTPGLTMGAISMGLPFVYLPAGPMLRGNYRGETLGSGADAWKYWDDRRAGLIGIQEWQEVESGIARSYGHCMTMGTASTMTAIADVLGMTLPGASSIPAADANHIRMASAVGRLSVEMVWEGRRPETFLTRAAFMNAAIASMALGCSTNAVIHLIAMARRAGVNLALDDLDAWSREVPVLANIRPVGERYLMEDFYYAGGLKGLLKQLASRLDLTTGNVTGHTLGEALADAEVYHEDVIRPLYRPVYREGSLAVLKGNLAPSGAIIKPASCDARFLHHTGPALVFDDYPSMLEAINDEQLDVTPDHVLVLRNAGPQGGPGMPEWGMLPVPKKLINEGIRDILRISDARMSGTSYGACVLHVSPESHVMGPLALLQTNDLVKLDLTARRLDMLVDDETLERRRAALKPPAPKYGRGYTWMYLKHIKQAHEGCDFDFLESDFGGATPEPDIY